MKVDLNVETKLVRSTRIKQLSSMFDVPAAEKLSHQWSGDVPIEDRDWNVGLIVGPSGAGKSSVARQMFGEAPTMTWNSPSVCDDFDKRFGIQDVAEICSAVGFNTIPSWMKPHAVLSTGEKFRVELARHLLEGGDPIVVDEFTSVVDRQVAHIGCHAVQKYVRKNNRKFVAVTCHYDVLEWLQPDWILEPATMSFQWRLLQRRPAIDVEIARVDHSAWKLFAPFHYLTGELHRAAACYVLFVGGVPAAFQGILHRPHPTAQNIKASSRGVTLPDYQGLGLIFVMVETLGAAHKAIGNRFRTYPAHPSLIRSFDRSKNWIMTKEPGKFSNRLSESSNLGGPRRAKMGSRPNAVFEYCGPTMDDPIKARAFIDGKSSASAAA
jgi:ABC-type lipoprotein export system ATPase subunit